MTTQDIIHETVSALTANKVRTSLTMLGIIIGISSVIALVAIDFKELQRDISELRAMTAKPEPVANVAV